ncbi:hypothetical protein [Alicyclobacillus dauci]|uniref:TadE-like protein n=1 Tax=Alicyclobacillus dauci TaxID=1475485 RepID=A0ABY6Z9Q0_9BACL|nr:hypothetical protein [Alicyclobacillus dauci]WAH38984.1 hypothetical protein NZD86_11130 [Alicyclobacillus dauci]
MTRAGQMQEGSVLLSVLSYVLVISILLSSMVYACQLFLVADNRQLQSVQSYAVARSIALTVLKRVQAGQAMQDQVLNVTDSTVHIQTVSSADQTSVKVEAQLGDVTDTVSFIYDTIAHRIRVWQDNGPGVVE